MSTYSIAYYNVPPHPNGNKIGVTTQFGNYKFNKLPFGLAASPAVFTNLMQFILSKLHYDEENHFIQCYIDDIIVASNDKDAHVELLTRILKLLQDNDLRLSANKVK